MLTVVLSLIAAALDGWLLYYLVELQKKACICALGWRWYFLVVFFVLALLNIGMALLTGTKGRSYLPDVLQTLLGIYGIFIIYVILSYVHKLKKESCKCSEGIAREVLQAVAIVQIVVIVLLFVAVLTMGPALVKMAKKYSKRSSRGASHS